MLDAVDYSKKLGPLIVAATVVTVVVTDFVTVSIVKNAAQSSALPLFQTIWPMALASDLAVLLVMSFLYRSFLEMMREVERREEIAKHQAIHDELTGLGNRRLLEDRLNHALAHVRRGELKIAVLMLDLDRFKQVNDSLGHGAGDLLVQEVSRRLLTVVRETDTVARVGGDEFVIIQSGPRDEADVRRLCSRIIESIGEPFLLLGKELHIGASVGAVLADSRSLDAADLVRQADITMYRAKAAGRNCYRIFCDQLEAEARRRDAIEAALRKAFVENSNLNLHYQPMVDASGKIIGLEALLRWADPALGAITPSEVVPIAEEAGLMDRLFEFSFKTACSDGKRWPNLNIAVNVSPTLFRNRNLPRRLKAFAEEAGVPCERIELEIIEGVFLQHGGVAEVVMKELREQGFRISLDDFGTGYSSLSYLRRFRVDKVKLDRSFLVADQHARCGETFAVVSGAVTLGHSLGLEVIAEGVETEEHERIALEAGCDGLQGYRYSPAISADEVDDLLRKFDDAAFAVAA
jgi:diguanylate cyclase (GGDEF)-like protein